MKWSLRDEKQMEELGFSKSAKGQRYYQMKHKFSSQLNQPIKQTSWQ